MGYLTACHWDDELGHNQHHSVFSIKPVAFPGTGGYLRRITNMLGNTGNLAFPLGVDELAQFRIDTRLAGKSPLYTFGKGQSRVTMALLNANNVTGVVSGSSVTFPNAWNNADLRLTIAGHRLQKEIFLKTGHPSQFQFRIDSHAGLDVATLQTPDFRILDPVLLDPATANMRVPLKWLVTTSGGKAILTVTLPPGDHAGKVLDPTLLVQPDAAAGKDTYIQSNVATGNFGSSTFMGYGANLITLIEFDCSSISTSAQCVSAALQTTAVAQSSARAFIMSCWFLAIGNAAWIEGTQSGALALAGEPCWNALAADGAGGVMTAWAGNAGCATAGTDYESTPVATFTGNVSDPVGTNYQCVLSPARVTGWFGVSNYGLRLATDGTGPYLGTSDHATAAYRPMLTVDYKLGGNVRIFRRGWRKI